nr:outer membrane lipoprotein-sorting protein [Nitrosomonas nitrosa]
MCKPNLVERIQSRKAVINFLGAALLVFWGPLITVNTIYSPVPGYASSELFDGEEIVRRVDQIRVPNADFTVEVKLESENSRGSKETRAYTVMMNRNRDSLVKTIAPVSEKGQTMLMRGQDFWVYLPATGQPIRLSLSQKLVGPVSNGDIARMSFSEDYSVEKQELQGEDSDAIAVLTLKPKGDWVTYEQVVLYVSLTTSRPIKAQFFTATGILLKSCEFSEYKSLGGAIRPTQLVIVDAIGKGEKSKLLYSDMREATIPNRYFTKEYMQKIE